jgi:exodeoxyribonuclease VII small subunit
MQLTPEAIQSLSYERAFAALEEIVAALESDSRTLEEALALYELGQALAERCASLLDQAELRVRQLSAYDAAAGFAEEDDLS